MALDPVPWLIDGGAVHSAAVARVVPFIATGGKSGVAEGGDLAVKALGTPGASVRVLAGAAAIRNTYAGQSSQSYVGRVLSDTNVAIAPTSGAIRSDMIILRIDDPEYGGSVPTSVPNGPYLKLDVLSDVGAGATELPGYVTYPAIPLARIDIPASTSVITGAMVKDIRKLVNARKERTIQVFQQNAGPYPQLTSANPTYASWPKTDGWDVAIPSWASRVIVIGTIAGALFGAPAGRGAIKVKLGTDGSAVETDTTSWDMAATGTDSTRQMLLAAGPLAIPTAYRGTTKTFAIRGTIVAGAGSTRPIADSGTTTLLDIEFIEDLFIP